MKWPLVPLSTIVEINPRKREWAYFPGETEVTFVPMQAVSEATASIEYPEVRTIDEVRKGFTPFIEGDILFAKITPCMENGKVAIALNLHNDLGFGSTEFHVLRAKKVVLPKYIYYFLRQPTFRAEAKQRMQGAVGQQRVPADFLINYSIPLPPLSEQQRIVEILDQADALRRKRAEADARAERILPALFVKMFGNPATNPKGWEYIEVEDILELERVGIRTGPFGSSLKRHEYTNDGVPVWGINNIQQNEFIEEGSLFISPDKYQELTNYEVEKGDILISRAGTVGKLCVARPTQSPSIIGTNLVRVSLNQSRMAPDYFVALFSHFPKSIGNLRASGDDNAYSFLNPKTLKSLRIPCPPLSLQLEFTKNLAKLRKLKIQQQQVSKQLDKTFDILLHRAFSGELTAGWREAHQPALLAEMETQAKLLAGEPVQLSLDEALSPC